MDNGLNQQPSSEEQQKAKRKNQIIFVSLSFCAVFIVGVIAYVVLSKIKNEKMSEALSQDQFEGLPEVSSQLQIECQKSALKISQTQDLNLLEAEYRQNAENCKDVYFALENESPFRKEGMYADLVVDIAKLILKTDQKKSLELLRFARNLKPWDFYLGPVSCDSQHVLDAYIESFGLTSQKVCYKNADLKTKIAGEVLNKNFSFLTQISPHEDVVWMGIPESDTGCPEKMTSVIETVKKLTTGAIALDETAPGSDENNKPTLNIKLSDKENISFIFSEQDGCLNLSSVLVPNLETSE